MTARLVALALVALVAACPRPRDEEPDDGAEGTDAPEPAEPEPAAKP